MGERVDASVTAPEKCAEYPADYADNETAPEGGPKARHGERAARQNTGDKPKEKRVEHEDKKPHGDENKGQTEDQKQGAHQSIDDPQEKRGKGQTGEAGIIDPGHDPCRDKDRHRGDEPTDEKLGQRNAHPASINPQKQG